MRTKELTRTAWRLSALLLLAATGHEALAVGNTAGLMEEVVVRGTAATPTLADIESGVRAQMRQYAERSNRAQRAALEREFARMRANSIQLAAAAIPTRG